MSGPCLVFGCSSYHLLVSLSLQKAVLDHPIFKDSFVEVFFFFGRFSGHVLIPMAS